MYITIAEKIRILAKRKGVTIQEIADALGYSRQNIYLRFKTGVWSERDLQKCAEALGCTLNVVFIDNDTSEPL